MLRKGFTLIELITVIIIIAILVALALPQYTRLIERGQGSAARSGLDSIRKAEGMYFALNAQYTDVLNNLTSEVPEIARITNQEWNYTISAVTALNKDFMATATRRRGAYSASNNTLTLTNDGVVNGTHPSFSNSW